MRGPAQWEWFAVLHGSMVREERHDSDTCRTLSSQLGELPDLADLLLPFLLLEARHGLFEHSSGGEARALRDAIIVLDAKVNLGHAITRKWRIHLPSQQSTREG
jgi:hypothetical protein